MGKRNKDYQDYEMSVIFNCAIRKCVELQSYPQCWQLFVCAKQSNHANTKLYTTMIWMLLNSSQRAHFNKALSLYKEMKTLNMSISIHTYCALINGCAKKLCSEQGMTIWNDLESDSDVIADVKAWNAIISLLCFDKNMNAAAQKYHDMMHRANINADNYTFCSLLNGYSATISHCIKHKIENLNVDEIKKNAENVMYDAVIAWKQNEEKNKDLNGQSMVVRAWMNLYATIGDIHSCLTIFEWILSKNEIVFEHNFKMKKSKDLKQWLNEKDNALNSGQYQIKIQFFGIMLKACLNKSSLKGKKLKKMIDVIMNVLLNQCSINPSTDIYGILFQLFRRLTDIVSIQELEQLYIEMKTKCDIKPTERELNEYGHTYLYFMDCNGSTHAQKQDFTDVLITEFKELKVTPSIYTKQLIEEV